MALSDANGSGSVEAVWAMLGPRRFGEPSLCGRQRVPQVLLWRCDASPLERRVVGDLVSLCAVRLMGSPSWASLDGVPDVGDLFAGRKRYAPKIVDGYQSLTTAGAINDDWLSNSLPKMGKAMEKWGALQRQDVAPDKISRTLLKDAAAFEKAAKSKDYAAAMKAFQFGSVLCQTYLNDLPTSGPGGSGKLNLSDPLAPP
ncbi:unnamed protein product [Effrenium voratum]|uniref:Uncharacterized protein n=1 Tax=Effrenium voratum TaxID=2562239 RepID=A0AA36IBQ7_9DINO|nr:unnamed protein product [Effrenium voratum]